MKKKIGLVGGIGPESTLDYYRRIVAALAPLPPAARPDVVVYSASVDELFALMEAKDWDGLVVWLLGKLAALRGAGADVAAIGANTPHLVFDRIRARSLLPLRSIVEATRDEAVRIGARRLGLLGTRFTMSSDFYARSFQEAGLEIAVPSRADQDLVHHRLMTEIELGILKESTREELLAVAGRLQRGGGIDAVILGCTELPLVLDRSAYVLPGSGARLPFLNTTALHVADLVRFATG